MKPRLITFTEITNNIFHLEFPTAHLMCSTLIRFQEHYECPKYRGKIFDLEEYMDWYADKFGNFTYFTDVAGFNIPSEFLKKFYEGKFNPLTRKEKKILELFQNNKEPFYIIATHKKSSTHNDDLTHEVSHGLYHLNKEYKKEVKRILKNVNLDSIYEWLKERGYNKFSFLDEAHAILLESAKSFSRCGIKASKYKKIRKMLYENYHKHYVRFADFVVKTKKVKI